MALGKEELLASIAAAGSAGRAAYDQAQQAIAAQQQEAVRLALASSVAGNAPAGAREQLAATISQPYQQRTAQITSNRATMDDWYNRQSAMQGTYLDTALRLAELQAAGLAGGSGGGGGGGGGGRGGGGGGDDMEPYDWEGGLSDLYGTTERGFDAIFNEAKALGLNSRQNPNLPRYMQTRQLASAKYGVPAEVADIEFGPSDFQRAAETAKPTLANFKTLYKGEAGAVNVPGNQSGPVNTFMSRLNPKAAKKAAKIVKKTKASRRGR